MNAFYEPKLALVTWAQVSAFDSRLSERSTDAELQDKGFYRLPPANPPVPGAYQGVVELNPIKISGVYQRQSQVYDLFPGPVFDPQTGQTLTVQQQKDAHDARLLANKKAEVDALRDQFLAAGISKYTSDALVWADLTSGQQQQVRSYKADMLAIDQQPGYPNTVVWPTPPQF